MLYKYEQYVLDIEDSKARFYVNGKLMFKGDGYVGIKYMIRHCKSEKVNSWFKTQLEQRENVKWKQPKSEKSNEDR